MKIVFCTAVYPKAWKWHDEFVRSINKQDYNDFDVLIANDGLNDEDIQKLKEEINNDVKIINLNGKFSISEIRIKLLEEAKKRYDMAIFGDFDDKFAINRVRRNKEEFDGQYTFYYNKLILENGKNVFKDMPVEVSRIEQIAEQNYLGLSNTAINLNNLSEEFIKSLKNVQTNVFDWYLYTKILLIDKKGKCVYGTYTEYRQSENNIAGTYEKNKSNIQREIFVKLEQYRLLKDESFKFQRLYQLYSEIKDSELDMSDEKINKRFKGYWWSIINLFKEEENV